MNEDEAYLDVAIRFLESCNHHIVNETNLQEVIGFECYHAFESIGGAFNSHYHHVVPRAHARKINAFVANSNHNRHVDGYMISAIAMILNAMRNKYLYPEQIGATYIRPQDQISITDSKRLVRKVSRIVQ